MISAKVVGDSKNEFGNRITTMVVTFPRFILAEFNTHRMFSRNSASSRAIPFQKMINTIDNNPFIPIAWQKDHKGMQGTEYFTEQSDIDMLIANHLEAKNYAVTLAYRQSNEGLTKQICNRYLEPFMWHTVIVTATEWENFFALRCPQYEYIDSYGTHKARSKKELLAKVYLPQELSNNSVTDWFRINKGQAEIHMMALAEAMWDAYNESIPKELKAGEWHIPYEDRISLDSSYWKDVFEYPLRETITSELKVDISTMMCARTSYTVFGDDGKEWNAKKYLDKCKELKEANPFHSSPFEHCAKTMNANEYNYLWTQTIPDGIGDHKEISGVCANFRGFIQYRKMFKNENITL